MTMMSDGSMAMWDAVLSSMFHENRKEYCKWRFRITKRENPKNWTWEKILCLDM